MGSRAKDLKARVRHRETHEGGTEILIDRIDQEKKRKVLHYLRANKIEPSAGDEEYLISVEVSTADSKRVCSNIVSFMQSIGLEEVSVSSAHFDRTRPEIEEESFPEHDYTLVDSEDVRELARRLEAGEESEFELIVSSLPDAGLRSSRRWRSRDVIKTIKESERQKETDSLESEENGQPETAASEGPNTVQLQQASRKHKWWTKKALRFVRFFRQKTQQKTDHNVTMNTIDEPNNLSEEKQANVLNRTDKSSKLVEPTKYVYNKNNNQDNKNEISNRRSDIQIVTKKNKPFKSVKKLLMTKEMKMSEAYAQTDKTRNVEKYLEAKSPTLSKKKDCSQSSRTTKESSTDKCSSCCCTDYTSGPVHPQFINLMGGISRDFPFYMNQSLMRQPFYYYMDHRNPFYQLRNYNARSLKERILVESCNTVTQTTTSKTTNTVTCSTKSQSSCNMRHEKKIYSGKFRPQLRKKTNKKYCKISKNSFSEEGDIQTDSSAHTRTQFTDFHMPKIMRNNEDKKYSQTFQKITCNKTNKPTANNNSLREQLAELHEKMEEIALQIEAKNLGTILNSFELSTKDKKPVETVDKAVECTGLDYIIHYEQKLNGGEYNFQKESNSNTKREEAEGTCEDEEKSDTNKHLEENFRIENSQPLKNSHGLIQAHRDDEYSEEKEHIVLRNQKEFKIGETPIRRDTGTIPQAKPKIMVKTEEHRRRGIVWGQYPDGRYGYGQGYDAGRVVPVTAWGPDYSLGLHLLQGRLSNRETKKKRKGRCKKLCRFFTGNKSAHLREQLLQQKLDLLEMKTVLTEINHTIVEKRRYPREHRDVSDSGEIDSEDIEESSEDYPNEGNVNEDEDNRMGDVQFSLSRPKVSKKTVTFRTPLTD